MKRPRGDLGLASYCLHAICDRASVQCKLSIFTASARSKSPRYAPLDGRLKSLQNIIVELEWNFLNRIISIFTRVVFKDVGREAYPGTTDERKLEDPGAPRGGQRCQRVAHQLFYHAWRNYVLYHPRRWEGGGFLIKAPHTHDDE